jgi:RNA polymerase sigma factor (sigma-70 family)
MKPSDNQQPKPGVFPVTRWSIVDVVKDVSDNSSFNALSELCEAYWYPLYVFLRSTGSSTEDAQDMIQEFLTMVVQRDLIKMADRNKGKLRTFLLDALVKYRSKVYRANHAQKRGGNSILVNIDQDWAEGRYATEIVDEALTPEQAFDQRWAKMVLESAFVELKNEYAAKDKEEEFEVLKEFLIWNTGETTYATAAQSLKTTEGNIKVKVLRARRRLRDILEEFAKRWGNPASQADLIDELKLVLGVGKDLK